MRRVIKGAFLNSVMVFGAVLGMALAAATSDAVATSARVKAACASDYFRLCSQFPPGSQATRDCMDENGSQLSKRCVDALVADGEVSSEEVAARAEAADEDN